MPKEKEVVKSEGKSETIVEMLKRLGVTVTEGHKTGSFVIPKSHTRPTQSIELIREKEYNGSWDIILYEGEGEESFSVSYDDHKISFIIVCDSEYNIKDFGKRVVKFTYLLDEKNTKKFLNLFVPHKSYITCINETYFGEDGSMKLKENLDNNNIIYKMS